MYKTCLSFFFYFSSPRCVGMFCRPVRQMGNRSVGILQRIHPPPPIRYPQFSLFVFAIFFYSGFSCERRDGSSVEPCRIGPVVISLFDSQNHISPSCQVPVVCPSLVYQLVFDTTALLVILDTGLNVNLNTQRAKSITAFIHLQAQRASVCRLAHAPPQKKK